MGRDVNEEHANSRYEGESAVYRVQRSATALDVECREVIGLFVVDWDAKAIPKLKAMRDRVKQMDYELQTAMLIAESRAMQKRHSDARGEKTGALKALK